jgi:hypothetical protein
MGEWRQLSEFAPNRLLKSLAGCHPERSEGSAFAWFQQETADASLRSA